MSGISKLDHRLNIKKLDSQTINIKVSNNEMLMSIVGQFNQNLKELEKLTNTIIFFRGNSITCKGKKDNLEKFSEAIKFFFIKTSIFSRLNCDNLQFLKPNSFTFFDILIPFATANATLKVVKLPGP